MRFHLPSFVLGVATGATGAALAPRLRPLVLEISTGIYRLADATMVRLARSRENFSDLLAEARARARGTLHLAPTGKPTTHVAGAGASA